jgi:hypothetical protein
MQSPQDIYELPDAPRLENQDEVIVGGRSVVILVSDRA